MSEDHDTDDMSGYPDEEDLERIRKWSHDDLLGLVDFVRERWTFADWGWKLEACGLLSVSTGGWSGNEELIGALQGNYPFWGLCWESSRRGGHFTFDLSRIPK